MSTRRNVLMVMAAAAVVGAAVGSMGALAEVRSIAQGTAPATERLGLKGYDPVAYFTLATPTPGLTDYEYVYDGVRYRFANARHRDLFKANPEKYAPQFGGSCAMNMSNGVRREADPINLGHAAQNATFAEESARRHSAMQPFDRLLHVRYQKGIMRRLQ